MTAGRKRLPNQRLSETFRFECAGLAYTATTSRFSDGRIAGFAKDPAQVSLFNRPAPPSVVCRSSQAQEPAEWQADFYASCLLMPRKLVMAAWDEMFPDRKPRVLRPEVPLGHPYVEIERLTNEFGNSIRAGADDLVLENFARPLAEQFMVSPIAMRIRLEKLGLLHREVPHQRIFAGGA